MSLLPWTSPAPYSNCCLAASRHRHRAAEVVPWDTNWSPMSLAILSHEFSHHFCYSEPHVHPAMVNHMGFPTTVAENGEMTTTSPWTITPIVVSAILGVTTMVTAETADHLIARWLTTQVQSTYRLSSTHDQVIHQPRLIIQGQGMKNTAPVKPHIPQALCGPVPDPPLGLQPEIRSIPAKHLLFLKGEWHRVFFGGVDG